VRESYGAATDQHYRLWYTDHALHGDAREQANEDPTRIVSYVPILNQALRDLAAWVEKGTPPPSTTNYRVVDGQVVVPPSAAERKGVQPVVTLTAGGGQRVEIRAGQPVSFTGTIEVPPGAGYVVGAEWDFEGKGTFAQRSPVPASARRVTVKATHSFATPGTYFSSLRATSNRVAGRQTPFARLENLDRVRVVVR
jgi:hypothetical protein